MKERKERERGMEEINLLCTSMDNGCSLTVPFFFFLVCMGEAGAWEGENLI